MNAQIRELIIAYVATAVPFLGALLMMRADKRAYFRWPVYSAMVMVLGVVVWNLIRKRLSVEWSATHASEVYYGALTLYFLLGLGVGALLGRLTRRTGAGSGNRDNPNIS